MWEKIIEEEHRDLRDLTEREAKDNMSGRGHLASLELDSNYSKRFITEGNDML